MVTPAGNPLAVNVYGGDPPLAMTAAEIGLPSEISSKLPGPEICSEGGASPPADTGSPEPVASTPTGFDMLIDGVVVLAPKNWMLATTPLDIGFVFKPARTQMNNPGVALHDSVFPAAVAAGPAVAAIDEIWLKE
jgi:hypothetical protein